MGIGFLWTARSRAAASKLTSKNDFVDLILGPGKIGVFEQVKPPARIACIARSLEKDSRRPFPGLKETIETLRAARVDPDRVILAYNPERQPGTPSAETDHLLESVCHAEKLARSYGAELLVGPGLKQMQQRENLYPELSKHCDIWLIQSQRLQIDPTTHKPVDVGVYRRSVRRIVKKLRQGNPRIRVFVQIVTTAGRGRSPLTIDQVASYVEAVADMAEAVRIYGGSPELLAGMIDRRGSGASSTSQPAGALGGEQTE